MPAVASIGWKGIFAFGPAGSSPDKLMDISNYTVTKREQHINPDGMRGSQAEIADFTVKGVIPVGGQIELYPKPDELAYLLTYIMGSASSGTFTFANVMPTLDIYSYKGSDWFKHAGVKINRATFSSSTNNLLKLVLDVEALTETPAQSAVTTLNATLSALQPYIHHNLIATIATVAHSFASWELVIDRGLHTDRFLNSQTRTLLPEGERHVGVSMTFPNTADESDLVDIAPSGGAGVFTFTNGGLSCIFTCPHLQWPNEGITMGPKNQESMRPIRFVARRASDMTAADELTVVNDATP